MSTAQIIYEQYRVLPMRVRQELKSLIVTEEEGKASHCLLRLNKV